MLALGSTVFMSFRDICYLLLLKWRYAGLCVSRLALTLKSTIFRGFHPNVISQTWARETSHIGAEMLESKKTQAIPELNGTQVTYWQQAKVTRIFLPAAMRDAVSNIKRKREGRISP